MKSCGDGAPELETLIMSDFHGVGFHDGFIGS